MFKAKKPPKQGRPVVTDISAVKNSDGEYVVSRSFSEVVDLLSEGVIEGIVSGDYTYVGKLKETGYDSVTFLPWLASGSDGETYPELGFLQSVFWNDVPVVDKDGFYNFPSINLETNKGFPEGHIPKFNSQMTTYAGYTTNDVLDLSINRPIGERLYGPEIKGGEDAPTINQAALLKKGVKIDKYAKTYTVLNKELQQIAVNIKISALFENVQAGPKTYKNSKQLLKCNDASTGFGDTKARTIEYNIYYRPKFDQRFKSADQIDRFVVGATSAWQGPIKETVTGKVDQGYIRSTVIDLSQKNFSESEGFEGWEIRIVRLTPEPLTSFYRAVSFVDSLVEIYGTKLRYPYSAMTYSQFDARSFTRVPSRAYDTKLITVKIPNNYNPLLKTYGNSSATANNFNNPIGIGTGPRTNSEYVSADKKWSKSAPLTDVEWDGGFATIGGVATAAPLKVWTDNPAWCFYDIITNPRYGLGEFINQSEVDKWTLYEIAKYCDELVSDTYGSLEPRFTINYLITSREEAFKVLNDLTSIFRGIAYYSNGSIFAVQDKFMTPSYQFNNSNVTEGGFTYSSSSKRARHSVAIVRYNDKKNLFQPAIEYVEEEESVRRYGIREIETTALGCTSRGQARRFADWILKSEALETETVSFSIGGDGSYLRPGDIVQIYDNFRSPLKYSGRTNTVIKGAEANVSSPAGVATQIFNKYSNESNFNTVILDHALNFTNDKSYKFSILTPTYNTTTGEANEIRRSQIQNLIFSGEDASTITGNFRSNQTGVCTQITFNTGDLFGGTGNVLNFDDYVITGYTNTGVWTRGSLENMSTSEQSYSGGCFSGENLIWSVEPTDENDTEFVSGHYLNYRVLNVKEEEDVYSISALAYASGKYDLIEPPETYKAKIESPVFPTGIEASASATIREGLGTLLNIQAGTAFVDNNKTPYNTLEVEFSIAAPSVSFIEKIEGTSNSKTFTVTLPTQNELEMEYVVALFTDEDDIPVTDQPTDTDSIKVIHPSRYASYSPFIVETIPNKLILGENKEEEKIENSRRKRIDGNDANMMLGEYLTIPDIEQYWIAVFAISEEQACSYGMIRRIDDVKPSITNSLVLNTSITKLTSQGNLGISTSSSTINLLESVEPGFSWESTQKGILTSLQGVGDPNDFEITIPNQNNQYRITFRKKSTNNWPSEIIYLEITGYQSPSDDSNFVLTKFYNDPNSLRSIVTGSGYGWEKGAPIDNWLTLSNNQKYEAKADWFSASGNGGPDAEGDIQISGINYGLNINSGAIDEFPLRVFDIVVEAEDSNGNTSAGNTAYAGTLKGGGAYRVPGGGEVSETFQPYRKVITSGPATTFSDGPSDLSYDIFGAKIEAPSGVFFAQIPSTNTLGPADLNYTFLDAYKAGDRGYPYTASAYIYPNGYLKIDLNPALKPDGEPTVTEDEIEIFFNNTAGIIFYFTTGDNRVEVEDSETKALNKAPFFTINPIQENLNKPNNIHGRYSDQITKYDGSVNASAFGGLIDLGQYKGNLADGEVGDVHRGYYLFGESDLLSSIEIPFPVITRPLVENVNLVFGFIDELHVLSAFQEDGRTPFFNVNEAVIPKTKTPKIFAEKNVNYSTNVIGDSEYDFSLDGDAQTESLTYSNAFVGTPRNSLFLNESSVMSAHDKALAFRAWGDVKLPLERVWYGPDRKNVTEYRNSGGGGDVNIITKNIDNITVRYIPLGVKRLPDSCSSRIEITLPHIVENFDINQVAVMLTQTTPAIQNYVEKDRVIPNEEPFRDTVVEGFRIDGRATEYYNIEQDGTIIINYVYSQPPPIVATTTRPDYMKFTFGILCSA